MIDFSGIVEVVNNRLDAFGRRDEFAKDPAAWSEYMLGIQVWRKQGDILQSIIENHNTAVAACYASGKSFVAAIAICWWIDTHNLNEVFAYSTAPTKDQVNGVLWRYLKRFHTLAKQRFEQGVIDHPLPGRILGTDQWRDDSGNLLATGRKPPSNMGDSAVQGYHAKYLLAVGDEATGLPKTFIDGLGNIASSAENRVLLICNPTDPNSYMGQLYKNRLDSWNYMNISAFDSPMVNKEANADFDTTRAKGLIDWDYINKRREEWGENDPRYISRVLGEWAFDTDKLVFTEEDIQRGIDTVVVPDPDAPLQFGLDVARSSKGDMSSLYSAQEGDVFEYEVVEDEYGNPTDTEVLVPTGRRGVKLRKVADWQDMPLSTGDWNNPGQAESVARLAGELGATRVSIDAAGLGLGVADPLEAMVPRRFAVNKVWGSRPSTEPRTYLNMRVEQYFEVKRRLHAGEIDLDEHDEVLLEELRGITYENSPDGRLKIESKDDMRKRNAKSPDHADGAWYALLDWDRFVYGVDAPTRVKAAANDLVVSDDTLEAFIKAMNAPGMPL
jgi:hypothetical protein